jgi:hypothetical protein
MSDGFSARPASAVSLVSQVTPPVVRWAWLGAAVLLFIVYVMARWFITGHAVPTDPGPDLPAKAQLLFIFWVQLVAMSLGALAFWYFVIRPWRREGQMSTTGMLYLCWLTLFFQDPMMNYTSATVLYNAYMVNLGTWTLGSTPGWTSPNGNLLPEPLLLITVGYTLIGYSLCFPVLALLNRIKERRPAISKFRLALIGIAVLILLDTLFESLLLRTGVYAYPGGIREITLFAGETYQFPMSEGLCYGGLTIGMTLVLLLYRDDKGQTFVEQGLDRLRVSRLAKQWIKFLALFGYVHISMFLVFTIPMQWFATHSDPFPEGYPSYMINGLCAYGPARDQCPGPGVMMPRPESNPF